MTKYQHLQWISTVGLSNCTRDLETAKRRLQTLESDRDTLSAMILAIGAMKGTKAYEKACKDHQKQQEVNQAQLEQTKQAVTKYRATYNKLLLTQAKLSTEIEANRCRRREIRASKHSKPLPTPQPMMLPFNMIPQAPVPQHQLLSKKLWWTNRNHIPLPNCTRQQNR